MTCQQNPTMQQNYHKKNQSPSLSLGGLFITRSLEVIVSCNRHHCDHAETLCHQFKNGHKSFATPTKKVILQHRNLVTLSKMIPLPSTQPLWDIPYVWASLQYCWPHEILFYTCRISTRCPSKSITFVGHKPPDIS